jgi:hypothetical protein
MTGHSIIDPKSPGEERGTTGQTGSIRCSEHFVGQENPIQKQEDRMQAHVSDRHRPFMG